MKKLIAILAVFAFLGAALFAQDAGTWTIGGSGYIGTRINFLNLYKDKEAPINHAQVLGSNYGDDGSTTANSDITGKLDLGYTKGIIKTSLSFGLRGAIGTSLEVAGNNFNFKASRDLLNLLSHDKIDDGMTGFGDLWGNYKFNVLEGLFVEVAYNKEESHWNAEGIMGDIPSHNSKVGKNYVLVDVTPMAGLSLGFKLPNLFQYSGGGSNAGVGIPDDFTDEDTDWTYLFSGYDFLDDSLRRIVFGAKYASGPVTVGFNFGLNQYGLDYAVDMGWEFVDTDNDNTADTWVPNPARTGSNRLSINAKYVINDQMWAAVDFRGEFFFKGYTNKDGKEVDESSIGFGARFNYEASPLNAQLTLKFENPKSAFNADQPKLASQTFTIAATVGYVLVPDYLKFTLGSEFLIPIMGEDLAKDNDNSKLRYTFTPELAFNFLGTGAGNWDTGMAIKWRVRGRADVAWHGQDQNEVTIGFKWKF